MAACTCPLCAGGAGEVREELLTQVAAMPRRPEHWHYLEGVLTARQLALPTRIRATAAWSLGMLADAGDARRLTELMEQEPDPVVQEQLVWALGRTRSRTAYQPLVRLLRDRLADNSARWAAVFALKTIGFDEAVEEILAQLRELVIRESEGGEMLAPALDGGVTVAVTPATLTEAQTRARHYLLRHGGTPDEFALYDQLVEECALALAKPDADNLRELRLTMHRDGGMSIGFTAEPGVIGLLHGDQAALRASLAKLTPAALAAVMVRRLARVTVNGEAVHVTRNRH